jgi:hypothetical protein
MTKKYQLLLHIGLPKTATTSLQRNVLMPLHQEGKINYLGKPPALAKYKETIFLKQFFNTKQVTNLGGGDLQHH